MAENMNMDMNNNMNYNLNNNMNGQYAQATQKKSSGGGLAWLVFIVVGIILLVIGVILYNGHDKDKYFKIKDIHETFSSESISKLDIDIPYGDITITKSSDKMIHIDAENVPDELEAKTGVWNAKKNIIIIEIKSVAIYLHQRIVLLRIIIILITTEHYARRKR